LRRNIFITYMIVVLISLSITGFLTVRAVEKYFVSNIEDALITDARVIQRFLAAELEKSNNDLSGIDKTVKELSADIGARITVVDLNGDVIADTQKITREMENHSQRPEIKQAYLGQIGKSIRYSSSIKAKMMYVAIPILSNNTIISVLRLSLPLSEIMHLSKFIWGIILSSTLIGLLIAFFASTIFTISVTRPIQDVACASREIARGNYDMKIYTQASGEIKILADSFNYMAKNLKQTINELRDGKSKTEAILGSMAESLIAVDHQCRVIMTNSAAEQLFNVKKDTALNKHLLEIVRNRELYDFINDVLMTKRSVNKELKIFTPEEKVFRINIAPINEDENSGAVAVLRDITDLRKLEKVRTEFVANVSHELKTPLTSISGFVETLLDGVYKDQDHCRNFLGIIKQETDRMTRLINELLYFSRIESSVNPIKKTKVDITDVLMKALSVFIG
jgi:two-component system phosphate regulon sensor histidine kinase PhoR